MQPIILYDIPSTITSQAWSPNTWKTRYVLNYKGIPYKTVWISFPDIANLCKEIGAKPSTIKPDGSPYFSLPVIQDPNTNKVVSESFTIAAYLESAYPESPKLFPAGSIGVQAAFCEAFGKKAGDALPVVLLKMSNDILQPRCEEYFRRTRESIFGMKMEQMVDDESQWAKYKAAFSATAAWYDLNGGHHIFGNSLTFGDINTVCEFAWYGTVSKRSGKRWEEMLTWDNGKWARLLEKVKSHEQVL